MKNRDKILKNRQLNRLAGRMIKKAVRRKGARSSLKAGLVFAGFGAVIYMSNRLIPKMADDYAFSFIWDGKTNGNLAYGNHRYRRVRTVKDLAASQLSHYMTWCGRTIGETLNQLVLMKDEKRLYDCVNTGVILTQLSLCLFAGRGRISLKKVSPAMALMLTAGYWFGAPHLVATSLWTTGAANYSWPGLLQSAFLLPYGLHYHDDSFTLPRPLAALSGLLAGWSNEAGGGMALAMSAAAVLSQRLALRGGTKPGGPLPFFASANTLLGAAPASGMAGRGQDTGWMACGLAGAAIGYGLLMLAPGNFKRIRIEKEYSDILSAELSGSSIVAQEDLYTPAMFLHYLKHSFSAVLLRELPLEIPVALYLMQKDRSRESTAYILALEAAAYGVPGILMLSPQFPKRAAYPGILYRLTAAVKALDRLEASFWSPGLNGRGRSALPQAQRARGFWSMWPLNGFYTRMCISRPKNRSGSCGNRTEKGPSGSRTSCCRPSGPALRVTEDWTRRSKRSSALRNMRETPTIWPLQPITAWKHSRSMCRRTTPTAERIQRP